MEPDSDSRGRSYNQYCAVARGLDVIGERWTLLIIRDLLVGPKRYKDLLDGLPGIGTNLLAARLRELEKKGIVRRTVLPPPAASTVYELTETGQALEPAIGAIGRWGARFLGSPRETDMFPVDGYMVAMRTSFKPQEARGIYQVFELRVGGRVFEIRIAASECTITQGPARDADAVFKMDIFTLHRLLKEGLAPGEALANGEVAVSGDEKALARFVKMFALNASGTSVSPKATRRVGDPPHRR
jgi:DNA-binding HxlR family transcriptional regulator/putative sterol carrier protein